MTCYCSIKDLTYIQLGIDKLFFIFHLLPSYLPYVKEADSDINSIDITMEFIGKIPIFRIC